MEQLILELPVNITGGTPSGDYPSNIEIPVGYRYVSHSSFITVGSMRILPQAMQYSQTMYIEKNSLTEGPIPGVQMLECSFTLDGSGDASGVIYVVVEKDTPPAYIVLRPEIN